ncbi:MAG: AcrB/AcrD/AcrF family protein [Sphingomonas sp.]|nr:AcrB/AcrD/AcrF family protein [Sphingomonas sp.]
MNTAENSFARELDRGWWQLLLIAWAGIAAWELYSHWPQIRWLVLRDTDDNLRLMQVHAWLGGQGWYDLRQYRLNPPMGFDIHWSRIVDLPIAGLILALKPLVGGPWAERLACGIAPLLPLSIALVALGAVVRRLVHPLAWPLVPAITPLAVATMQMFEPMRIDHHGWQLASLAVTLAGLVDDRPRRGGLMVGLASAFSLAIGLELVPYVVLAGGMLALRWVAARGEAERGEAERGEAERLGLYGVSLAGGCVLGYLGFASYANAAPRCDALTPVWLSLMVCTGALLALAAQLNPRSALARLALAGLAAAVVAGLLVALFPQCLGRPEGISDELARNWLNNVREAKPIYTHPLKVALPIAISALLGILGAGLGAWRARRDERLERFLGRWNHLPARKSRPTKDLERRSDAIGSETALVPWLTVLAFVGVAGGLLLWQMRAGPAAQLLAIPGMVALAWIAMARSQASGAMLVRVVGTVAAFLIASNAATGLALRFLPLDPPSKFATRVNRAGASCTSLSALAPLDRLPPRTILTFVDLGPRLITLTHHRAVAGPYHRNGAAILDVQHAFEGSPERFRAIAAAHGARLLLICPGFAESTIYRSRAKGGFYDRLARGERFAFLAPLPLPRGSPLRLYRIADR